MNILYLMEYINNDINNNNFKINKNPKLKKYFWNNQKH